MAKNFNKNKVKRGWKTALKIIAIVAVVALLGGVAAMALGSLRERNPDNLIKVDENYLKDVTSNGYGLSIDVDEDGTIHLKGETSKNEEYIVQTVTLPAGTYTISGLKESNLDKVALKAVWGEGNSAISGTDNATFTLDAEYAVQVVITIQGAEDGENVIDWTNKLIRPVIVEGETAGDFYK